MNVTQRAIDARNKLNSKADQIESALLQLMPDFLNKKVWKKSGSYDRSAAFIKAIDAFEKAHGMDFSEGFYMLMRSEVAWIHCELVYRYEEPNGDGYAISNKIRADFRIGKRNDDGVLVELEDGLTYPEGRPQFDLVTVKAAADRAYELEKQARELRSSISVFANR